MTYLRPKRLTPRYAKAVSCFPACFTTRPCLLLSSESVAQVLLSDFLAIFVSVFHFMSIEISYQWFWSYEWWHSYFLSVLAFCLQDSFTRLLFSTAIKGCDSKMQWVLRLVYDSPMIWCFVWLMWTCERLFVVCYLRRWMRWELAPRTEYQSLSTILIFCDWTIKWCEQSRTKIMSCRVSSRVDFWVAKASTKTPDPGFLAWAAESEIAWGKGLPRRSRSLFRVEPGPLLTPGCGRTNTAVLIFLCAFPTAAYRQHDSGLDVSSGVPMLWWLILPLPLLWLFFVC